MSDDAIQATNEESRGEELSPQLKGKKLSWQKLRRNDSLEMESGKFSGRQVHGSKGASWSVILQLAFQSIGIVYGDIGTSPLYVYASTFSKGINHNDDILGVLSLIFYTLTLIPLIKYVLIVLRANDNGDGGTFALYSLICRYARVGLLPSRQVEDRDVSNFRLELPSKRLRRASKLKSMLESSKFAKFFLLFATMLGTSMVIGDGVLTPCISVLSAVGGIKEAASTMTQDSIVWISVAILICLFMVQRFGTDKVGYSFAPIICVWFSLIGGIGIYNLFKYDPAVVKALNPKYIVDYFRRNKKDAWISLGGVVLAITAFLTNGDVTEKEGEPDDDGQNDEDTKMNQTADKEKEQEEAEREIEIIDKACRAGVVHLIGENEVMASKGASLGDRIIINYAYNFLKKNLRQSEKVFDIPHKRMLKVGLVRAREEHSPHLTASPLPAGDSHSPHFLLLFQQHLVDVATLEGRIAFHYRENLRKFRRKANEGREYGNFPDFVEGELTEFSYTAPYIGRNASRIEMSFSSFV
ncbi:hypothetical protein SADUNF_Sadunf14G0099100 [Salix dunnii]|uniref:K+ potassium transporter integral membrane domain-containing protein n=1 Tax=Salix dunnii TaxID=1413687 RepID=A0A835JLN6_9ROSI|nr:hypothetical protein SADUNF_Sadunf14G0099100 [Salix dunnii]